MRQLGFLYLSSMPACTSDTCIFLELVELTEMDHRSSIHFSDRQFISAEALPVGYGMQFADSSILVEENVHALA
jgi:hypothetical protein